MYRWCVTDRAPLTSPLPDSWETSAAFGLTSHSIAASKRAKDKSSDRRWTIEKLNISLFTLHLHEKSLLVLVLIKIKIDLITYLDLNNSSLDLNQLGFPPYVFFLKKAKKLQFLLLLS